MQKKPRYDVLKLSELARHPELQPRASINIAVVEEYRDMLKDGAKFPAVTVFFDKTSYHLADGWHRYEAHQAAGVGEIRAEIYEGTFRDAKLHALSANANHGLRRTNEDKRRAVGMLLIDPEWSTWSDREIARHLHVSNHLVAAVKVDSYADDSNPNALTGNSPSDDRKYRTKHGTEAVMKTANIGRSRPAVEPSPEDSGDAHAESTSFRVDATEESSTPPETASIDDPEFEVYLNGLHSQIETLQRANDALSATDQGAEMMKQVQLLLNAENSLAVERERANVREKALRWFGSQYAELRKVLSVKNDRDVLPAVRKLIEEAK